MRHGLIGLAALVILPTAATARDQESGCGGDAYSFAEVVPARRGPRRGEPLTTVPTTLCADLQNPQRTHGESVGSYVDPPPNETVQRSQPGTRGPFRPPGRRD